MAVAGRFGPVDAASTKWWSESGQPRNALGIKTDGSLVKAPFGGRSTEVRTSYAGAVLLVDHLAAGGEQLIELGVIDFRELFS